VDKVVSRSELVQGALHVLPNDILSGIYAQRLFVEVLVGGQRQPCPLEWLDSFCMRNFTGQAEFDDTLPTGEGSLEAGFRVSPARLAEAMGEWFTRRGRGQGQAVRVEIRRA
jgi:hypothetical protein